VKILYHHRTRSKDGQFVHIEEMILALRELGHEVIVVAPAAAQREPFGAEAGLVAVLKRHLPRFAYELMELAYAWVAYRRLARAVAKHRPDCLYERYNLFLPAGVWIKRRFRLPMLLEVNAPILEERVRHDGLSLEWLARWTQRYTWRGADYVLPVTRALGDIVESYGVEPARIVVTPNGIDLRRFSGAPDSGMAKQALGLEGKLVLGFIGFVRRWHGLHEVMTMMARDPPGSSRFLLIVGDGPERSVLERQAHSLGIESRVRFTGIVDRDKVGSYLAAFDIALQPAVVAYASPLKLFEYLALGKAIVAPAQPNIMEILADGHNAVLFDPSRAGGLAAAVDRLCADASLRRAVGEQARRTILERRLTWCSNAERAVGLARRAMANA
jgi:glycosyltransferase involved in cell wall biosynthesis